MTQKILTEFIASLEGNQAVAVNHYEADLQTIAITLSKLLRQYRESIPTYLFSHTQGMTILNISNENCTFDECDTLPKPELGSDPILHYLKEYNNTLQDGLFIFLDLHKYIEPPQSDRAIISSLRLIGSNCYQNPENYKRLILLGEQIQLPKELIRLIPIIRIPLPSKEKRYRELSIKLDGIKVNEPIDIAELTQVTSGLTVREIRNQFDTFYHKCVLAEETITEASLIEHFTTYKIILLKSLKVEVFPPGKEEFRGHNLLRNWLDGVKEILKPEAREFGIPFPKGCLLTGISGVGKTVIAKSLSNEWHLPLMKLSIPALKGSLVGESEQNLIHAWSTIQTIKGIVLIDEVDKIISTDTKDSSGVSTGLLAILLDILNENQTHFFLLTANNADKIPAELMRKGRLDKIWFADLPNLEERKEILELHFLKGNRIEPEYIDKVKDFIPLIAERTELFSGAELAALVTEGLTKVYLEGNAGKPDSGNFIGLISGNPPLAKIQRKQHQKLMEWSKKAQRTSIYESSNQNFEVTI